MKSGNYQQITCKRQETFQDTIAISDSPHSGREIDTVLQPKMWRIITLEQGPVVCALSEVSRLHVYHKQPFLIFSVTESRGHQNNFLLQSFSSS